jgi:hypothetical protein
MANLSTRQQLCNCGIRTTFGNNLFRNGVRVGMGPKIVHVSASRTLHYGHVTAHPVDYWT